jgi:hypothetical protein
MRWRSILPILILTGLSLASAAEAQETIDQFNAANAENRRNSAAESQQRNDALQLGQDQGRGLLSCQGAGSAAATGACQGNVQIQTQQRGLLLDNRAQQLRDSHRQNLQGIGVSPLQ